METEEARALRIEALKRGLQTARTDAEDALKAAIKAIRLVESRAEELASVLYPSVGRDTVVRLIGRTRTILAIVETIHA